MLKLFRVSNFRSLVNIEFRPVGSNLVIGPNNVGKTSLCSALRFVSLTASSDLETAAQNAVVETWNIANVYVKSPTLQFDLTATLEDSGQSLDFEYTLVVGANRDPQTKAVTLRAMSELLLVTGGKFAHTPLLECTDGQAYLLNEEQFLGGKANQAATLSPGDATMLSRLYDLQSNRRANLFKRYLQSWLYFNLNPHALRSPEVRSEKPVVFPDGGNLSKVMFTLHNERPRVEKKVLETLKTIEPKADFFTFMTPDPKSVYLYLMDSDDNRFGTASMSDGTLRYIVFAYLVYALADAKAASGYSPLIMIEEPENGLYVGQLRPLFEKIDPSGASGQFIFTSHSPYFIDLWEKNLAGIHVLKPGKPSSILINPEVTKRMYHCTSGRCCHEDRLLR